MVDTAMVFRNLKVYAEHLPFTEVKRSEWLVLPGLDNHI